MPRRTAGKLKDKPGQFTTEIWKTKQRAYLQGFMRGIRKGVSAVNWTVLVIGMVIGSLLTLIKPV